jgi:predicted ABC-type ATPase
MMHTHQPIFFVFAGNNGIRQMQKAKEMGNEVTVFYIALRNVNQNIGY